MNKAKPKKIVFKYTVKLQDNQRPKTFYVKAYDESLAREALAEDLKIDPKKLRVNKRNLPYKVRQMLFDDSNKDYQIHMVVNKKPEDHKSFDEIQNNLFDVEASRIKSLKYRIQALLRQDAVL